MEEGGFASLFYYVWHNIYDRHSKKCLGITISDINITCGVVIILSFKKCARKSEKSFEKRRILAAYYKQSPSYDRVLLFLRAKGRTFRGERTLSRFL